MISRASFASLLALSLAACSATQTPTVSSARGPVQADEALVPYYDGLRQRVTLPVAPAGAALPGENTTLTRIAFGSCNHQSRSQHMWAEIMKKNPQLFMLIGDNIYGDSLWEGDADLSSLRDAYAEQAQHPEFAAFRRSVPMMTTWDDHDFGFNDGGADFAFRRWSEDIYETFWNSPQAVRDRPGVYESRMFGPEGKRVQVLMLDTRYFRSGFDRMPFTEERPPLGPYVPSGDTSKTMLGEAQWQWLSQELAKPADLRLVVSSIQVITDAHDYESWEQLPAERERLMQALGGANGGGTLLLTGDRHAGGIYRTMLGGNELWELTSSSLNLAFNDTASNTAREPDPTRVTDLISEENFGTIDIDWAGKTFTMRLFGNEGETRAERTVRWSAR